MLPQLDDDDICQRLKESLGLDTLDSDHEVEAGLDALDPESEKSHRKRTGVGFPSVNKRVFCAEETKLKAVLKSKKGLGKDKAKPCTPKEVSTPMSEDSDEEDISRLDMIFRAIRERKERLNNIRKMRLGLM